ncbi:hypothetical protein C5167_035420, partial [Papaver somniferum]
GMSQLELEDEVQDDLKRATGEFVKDGDHANKLNHILQLTRFSDPVYDEAYVTAHYYNIVLDVTIDGEGGFLLSILLSILATSLLPMQERRVHLPMIVIPSSGKGHSSRTLEPAKLENLEVLLLLGLKRDRLTKTINIPYSMQCKLHRHLVHLPMVLIPSSGEGTFIEILEPARNKSRSII